MHADIWLMDCCIPKLYYFGNTPQRAQGSRCFVDKMITHLKVPKCVHVTCDA